jgi:hypothetical protein
VRPTPLSGPGRLRGRGQSPGHGRRPGVSCSGATSVMLKTMLSLPSRPAASKRSNIKASARPRSWICSTAPFSGSGRIRRMPVLEQIQPAMKTRLATPVIRAFSCPCRKSSSISSAGAQIIAMVPNILSLIEILISFSFQVPFQCHSKRRSRPTGRGKGHKSAGNGSRVLGIASRPARGSGSRVFGAGVRRGVNHAKSGTARPSVP